MSPSHFAPPSPLSFPPKWNGSNCLIGSPAVDTPCEFDSSSAARKLLLQRQASLLVPDAATRRRDDDGDYGGGAIWAARPRPLRVRRKTNSGTATLYYWATWNRRLGKSSRRDERGAQVRGAERQAVQTRGAPPPHWQRHCAVHPSQIPVSNSFRPRWGGTPLPACIVSPGAPRCLCPPPRPAPSRTSEAPPRPFGRLKLRQTTARCGPL